MYSKFNSVEQLIADELAIQNMFTALTYGIINAEEQIYVEEAIRAHILMNANRVHKFIKPAEDESNMTNGTKTR